MSTSAPHPADMRIRDAFTALRTAPTLAAALHVAARHARQLVGADGVTVVLRDGDRCSYVDEDAIQPLWKGRRFPMAACISGWVMRERTHVVIEDIRGDLRIPQDLYRETFVRSLAMMPMRRADPVGAMGAYWADRHGASAEELELLRRVAEEIALRVVANGGATAG